MTSRTAIGSSYINANLSTYKNARLTVYIFDFLCIITTLLGGASMIALFGQPALVIAGFWLPNHASRGLHVKL
ncbi:hypothetical protein KHA96_12815 [Bacillus sp. FJAT-49711]|uniref:hypothetical protein n=1 Tax=Bacillus sp. FJAT-49711 TaxID=2833585 RepID=UPI001BCA6226|nr:hypothetical protein [Bacillus sp. FJAT-49711]MBS4219199.1 hypothetical protein [Bacillus sp. FJAT-49711]